MVQVTQMTELLGRRLGQVREQNESGQTLVEYALLLTMISLASITALLAVSGTLNTFFQSVGNAL